MSTNEPVPPAPEPETPAVDELVQRVVALNLKAEPYQGKADCPAVQVSADAMLKLMAELQSNPAFAFDMLASHTVVDRIETGTFELVYYLYSLTNLNHLLVSVSIARDNPVVPTVCRIWRIAEWQEREVYDLFGVQYDSHPDLRRVFLEDEWDGFPLRKDYQDDFMLSRAPEEEAS